MVKKVSVSISILCSISAVLAYLCFDGQTAQNFAKWFLLFFLSQVILHFSVTYAVELSALKRVRQQEIELAIASALTTANLTCPCGVANVETVNIVMGRENSYKCIKCNKIINANIKVSTTLKTQPVDAGIITNFNIQTDGTVN